MVVVVIVVMLVPAAMPTVIVAPAPMRITPPIRTVIDPTAAIMDPARVVIDVARARVMPSAADPDIAAPAPVPVTRCPNVADAWSRHYFVAQWRWRHADVDAQADLRRCRRRNGDGCAAGNRQSDYQCQFACVHVTPPGFAGRDGLTRTIGPKTRNRRFSALIHSVHMQIRDRRLILDRACRALQSDG